MAKYQYVLDVIAPGVKRTTTYPSVQALAEDVRAYYHSLGWDRQSGDDARITAQRYLKGDEPGVIFAPDGKSSFKVWREPRNKA